MIIGLFSELFNVASTARKGFCYPSIGSIVYCDLFFGHADHSGVCVEGSQIVHLNGDGVIESISYAEFFKGTTSSTQLYVSCKDGYALCDTDVAERALEKVGSNRNYNFLIDNCHQFVSGCISGNFDNSNNFLWMMKDEAEKVLGVDDWLFADPEYIKDIIKYTS